MQGKHVKEQNLMSFEGFCKCVSMDLKKQLSSVSVSVELVTVQKNNGQKCKAVVISEAGCNTSPAIYLEEYFQMYVDGKELAQVEDEIVQVYTKNAGFMFKTSDFTEWDNISKKIAYRLVNFERNKELLATIPHRKFLDLAVIYYALFDMPNAESHCATVKITNSHMSLWNKTEEDLYSTALENTSILMPYSYTGIEDVITESITGSEKDELSENARSISIMKVLTNKQKLYGATAIIYQHLLQTIAEKTGTDLYILPSSIHEVIILPAIRSCNSDELVEMVRSINQTELAADEVLSDNVYFYNKETDEISICYGVNGHE